jgi:Flp pilus assembly protein TadD
MAGQRRIVHACCLALTAVLVIGGSSAAAFPFPKLGKGKPEAARRQNIEELLKEIDRALVEDRLIDASQLLDDAYLREINDKRLVLRSGELNLARKRFAKAVENFTEAEGEAAQRAQALQGKGIALAGLGRVDDATPVLNAAVALDASLWRAWNTLAIESDRRHDWAAAEASYASALKAPGVRPVVLNNRGYSRLLQGRYADASADFVRALELDPGLATARTNLRLSLALQGQYGNATQISGVEDRGTVLNNAGFAAAMRGDYPAAERLFQSAVEARGSAYGRALENLKMVKALNAQPPVGKLQ